MMYLITVRASINLSKYAIGCDVGSTDFPTVFTLKGFTPFYKEMVALDKVEINHVGIKRDMGSFTKGGLIHITIS